MAQAYDLSVARAIFITALLRPDPRAADVNRDDATLFARSVLRTCNICTSSNVKVCKSFIVRYILPTPTRVAALAKYLLTLSKSFAPRDSSAQLEATKAVDENEGLGQGVNGKVQQPPEPAFKRLHLLYILHDVLMHQQTHNHMAFGDEESSEQINGLVGTLVQLTVCGCGGKSSTSQAVLDLLSFWSDAGVFSNDRLEQIRTNVRAVDGMEWEAALGKITATEESKVDDEKKRKEDEAKWTIPDRHGVLNDPTAPWHELPAGNGLYLKRTTGYPLYSNALPAGGVRVKNGGDEADSAVKQDVQTLYEQVLRCYDKYTAADEVQEIDALGNVIWKDPERPTRNYWGFTLDGIDKRRELAAHFSSTIGFNGGNDSNRVSGAVERARALAAERGRGMGRGRGMVSRGGWDGGRRW